MTNSMENSIIICRIELFGYLFYKKEIAMKKEEIISVLSELHKISGLRVSLHGTDFNEIAAYPEEKLPFCANVQKSESEYKRCRECDAEACRRVLSTGEAYAYKCRHGLSEVICPLYNFGTLTGYIMMGQAADEHVNRKALKSALMATGATEEQARVVTDGISEVSSDMLRSYMKIMTICAEYMTLTNALPSKAPRTPELAKIYLHENFREKITIKDVCRALGCSKSALLTSFKLEYGTTVNSYLADIRINEAKKLLTTTSNSISDVADRCGFYDQSYFSKVFSQKMGITPSEYRKEKGQ